MLFFERMVEVVTQFIIYTFLFTQLLKPKLSVLWTYIISPSWFLIMYSFANFVLHIGPQDMRLVPFTNISFILILFLLYKGKLWKKIVVYILMLGISLISDTAVLYITKMIWGLQTRDAVAGNYPVAIAGNLIVFDIMLLISLIVFILILFVKNKNSMVLKSYIIMGLFTLFHLLSFIGFSLTIKEPKTETMISQLVFQLFYLILIFTVFYIIQRMYNMSKEQEKLNRLKETQETNYRYYTLASEKYAQIAKIRHDTKNQLQTIKYLIANGEQGKADSMVSDLNAYLDSSKNVQYCENPIINAVLTLKINSDKCKDIKTEILLKDTSGLSMSDYELCSLFSNLIDNAIESCLKIEDISKRYIQIKSGIKNNIFIIKISNTYADLTKKKKDGTYETSKKESGHGYGMSILKEITTKYNGSFFTDQADGMFTTQISIPVEKAEDKTPVVKIENMLEKV